MPAPTKQELLDSAQAAFLAARVACTEYQRQEVIEEDQDNLYITLMAQKNALYPE